MLLLNLLFMEDLISYFKKKSDIQKKCVENHGKMF
jgi:hypothetical protein